MKILLVASNYVTPEFPILGGGSAVVAQDVAAHLLSEGHGVTVVRAERAGLAPEVVGPLTVHNAPKPNLYIWHAEAQRSTLQKIAWHAIEDRGPVSSSCQAILREVKPDLVASHNIMGVGSKIWGIAAAAGVPSVHTMHDYYLLCPRTTRLKGDIPCLRTCRSCRVLTQARRRETRYLSAVTSVSRHLLDVHLADQLFEDVPAHRIIANAADRTIAVSRPARPATPVRFGFMGRGSVEKGLHILVTAFEAIAKEGSQLVMAGGVTPEVRAAIHASPRRADMTILGQVDRETFYAAVDVVVVPSLHAEPFSLVIAEAQARGLAVIASQAGGMPEALGDETLGWLVPPGDATALAATLRSIARAPDQLDSRSRRALERSRTWTKSDLGRAYSDLYTEVARRRPDRS